MPNQNLTLVFGDVVYNFNSTVGHLFARSFINQCILGLCRLLSKFSADLVFFYTSHDRKQRGGVVGLGAQENGRNEQKLKL